jgi:hypothetical protein
MKTGRTRVIVTLMRRAVSHGRLRSCNKMLIIEISADVDFTEVKKLKKQSARRKHKL